MLHTRMIAILLAGLVVLVNAQTFQYSRGWTNGKRATAAEPLPNQMLVPGLSPGGLSSLKPNEKALLRRFLRNPCELRISNLLAGHPIKDLFQLGSNSFEGTDSAGSPVVLPQFLIDPDEGNGNGAMNSNFLNGRPIEDELRFKRDVSTGSSDPHQKMV